MYLHIILNFSSLSPKKYHIILCSYDERIRLYTVGMLNLFPLYSYQENPHALLSQDVGRLKLCDFGISFASVVPRNKLLSWKTKRVLFCLIYIIIECQNRSSECPSPRKSPPPSVNFNESFTGFN